MNNIPTAKEVLSLMIPYKEHVSKEENEDSEKQNEDILKDWVELHIKNALKKASEEAEVEAVGSMNQISNYEVDKDSIINSYSREEIK